MDATDGYLSFEEAREIIVKLHGLGAVLIGGQALDYWAERYAPTEPSLMAEAPFTSADIDFANAASQRLSYHCAERLGGVPRFDEGTNQAIVLYHDRHGLKRQLDIMVGVAGVEDRELKKHAVPVLIDRGDGEEVDFPVLHPVHCLMSRIYNVVELGQKQPARRGPHSIKQLRASVHCARAFLREYLEANPGKEGQRYVLDWNKKLFWHAFRNMEGRQGHLYGGDPMEAVLVDERLPTAFIEKELPRQRARVAMYRARRFRAEGLG